MTPVFYGVKKDGILSLERQPLYDAYVKSLKDGRYTVTVKRWRPTRTNQQNKYYWGVVIQMISDETGQDKDGIHDGLRAKFLTTDQDKPLQIIRSTTSLNTKEMMEYIDKIVLWAAEFLGIVIPLPDYVEF